MGSYRLARSMLDRVLGGVCGGIGAYLGVSAWWLRAAFIALAVALPNLGILLYVLLWLILPAQTLLDLADNNRSRRVRPETTLLLGGGVILVGIIALADTLGVLNGLKGDLLTPALLFLIGLALLARQLPRRAA